MLFVGPRDPHALNDRSHRKDLTADALVYRYRIGDAASDGLPGSQGTFEHLFVLDGRSI